MRTINKPAVMLLCLLCFALGAGHAPEAAGQADASAQIEKMQENYRAGLKARDDNDHKKALDYFRDVYDVMQKQGLGDRELEIAVLELIGDSYESLGDDHAAIEYSGRALALARKYLPADNEIIPYSMMTLAESYFALGDMPKSIAILDEAVPLLEKTLGPEHGLTIIAAVLRGFAYSLSGQIARAVETYEKELPRLERVLGPEEPNTVRAMVFLTRDYVRSDQPEKALAMGEQALPRSEKVFGPASEETAAICLRYLSAAHTLLGEPEKALSIAEEAWQRSKAALGEQDPQTIEMMLVAAAAQVGAGHKAEAEAMFRDIIALLEKSPALSPDDRLDRLKNLGMAKEGLGRFQAAEKDYRQGYELSVQTFGAEHPNSLIWLVNLIRINKQLDHPAETEAWLKKLAAAAKASGNTMWMKPNVGQKLLPGPLP